MLAVLAVALTHRSRGRLAKAFLVDDRNALLREIALDPACGLTYDQAVAAGALAAEAGPVQVAKLHAQTVRGGALGLVLLTEGPAADGDLAFARELLAGLQDRFDHAVRARLEVALRAEQDAVRARKDLEATQAEVRARSRGLAGVADVVTAASQRIAAETAAVHAKARDVERREEELRTDRQACDGLSQHLDELRASLLTRTAEVEAREAGAAARSRELDTREDGIRRREAEVSEREVTVGSRGEEMDRRAADLSAKEESARNGAAEAERSRAEAERSLAEVGRSQADAEARRSEFERLREALDAREFLVSDQEGRVAKESEDWQATLQSERSRLRQRMDAFRRETADRKEELAAQARALDEREKALAAEAESLARREERLREREEILDIARNAMRHEEDDARARKVKGQTVEVEAQE